MVTYYFKENTKFREVITAGIIGFIVLSGYGCNKLTTLMEQESIERSIVEVQGDVYLEDNQSSSGIMVTISSDTLPSNIQIVTTQSGRYTCYVRPEVYLCSYSKEGYQPVTQNIQITSDNVILDTVVLSPLSNSEPSTTTPSTTTWVKHSDVAQYGGASWDNFIKREANISLEDAKAIAENDPNISFFFYMKGYSMYLEAAPVANHTNPIFYYHDAVFFSGDPWFGSAPGYSDSYVKEVSTPVFEDTPVSDEFLLSESELAILYEQGEEALKAGRLTEGIGIFESILDTNPNDARANLITGLGTIIKIIEDPTLREVVTIWEERGLIHDPLPTSIDEMMSLESPAHVQQRILSVANTSSFTVNHVINDISDVIETVFIPRLDTAIAHLEKTTSTSFSMTLTQAFTGRDRDIEIDNGDIHAITAFLSLIKGLCHPLVSYYVHYDENPTGIIDNAFLAANPQFGTLRVRGRAHMKAAGEAFIKAIEQSQKAIISIQSETDDQSNDVIKKDQLGSDIQLAMEVLSMTRESLAGSAVDVPYILDTGEERTFKVNLGALFTNPIRDIRHFTVSSLSNLPQASDFPEGFDFSINGLFPEFNSYHNVVIDFVYQVSMSPWTIYPVFNPNLHKDLDTGDVSLSYMMSTHIQRDGTSFTGSMATADGIEVVVVDTTSNDVLLTLVWDRYTYSWLAGTEMGVDLVSKVLTTDIFHTQEGASFEPKVASFRIELRHLDAGSLYRGQDIIDVLPIENIWSGTNGFDFSVVNDDGYSVIQFDNNDSDTRWYDFRFFDKDTFDSGTKLPEFTFTKMGWSHLSLPLNTSEMVAHSYTWIMTYGIYYDSTIPTTYHYGLLDSVSGELGSVYPNGLGTNEWYVEVSSWNNDSSVRYITRRAVDRLTIQTTLGD